MNNRQLTEIQLEIFLAISPLPDANVKARKRNAEAQRLYQARPENAHKITARREVKTALAHGDLARPGRCADCEVSCAPEAHHPDYARPLAVEWLCRACHMRRHRLSDALPGQMMLPFTGSRCER